MFKTKAKKSVAIERGKEREGEGERGGREREGEGERARLCVSVMTLRCTRTYIHEYGEYNNALNGNVIISIM